MAVVALRQYSVVDDRVFDPPRRDPITHLPNRQQYDLDALHWGPTPSTLVLVTLAEPTDFNDVLRVFGHARADALVRAGATRLRRIVGSGSALYHVGGLNFAFRLPGRVEPDAPPLIRRILEGFRKPLQCDDVPIDTRVSIGMKGMGGPGGNPAENLRCALSAAQDSHRSPSGWSWFDRKRDDAHRRAFRLLSDLKGALEADDQLELVYQPKVILQTGVCRSVEALLRWKHPEFGPVSPGEFVALAETTALVTPMTRWVIDAAVKQAAIWQQEGMDLAIAVNISPKNLEEPDFVEFVTFCCATRGVDRDRIELEVTEGVSASRGGLILDRLAALRALGFSIAIDDFGSGYSNMAYLTQLSAHTLKIDQSLVRGVQEGSLSGRLVSSIVQMGRDLGYRIVAEGIETETERALLSDWGCDYGQGWHLGRPMSAAAFSAWYAAAK